MFHDYFDLWLMSPFYHNSTKTSFSKIPFQSKSVSNNAIKFLLENQQDLYSSMTTKIKTDKSKKVLFDIDKPPISYNTY